MFYLSARKSLFFQLENSDALENLSWNLPIFENKFLKRDPKWHKIDVRFTQYSIRTCTKPFCPCSCHPKACWDCILFTRIKFWHKRETLCTTPSVWSTVWPIGIIMPLQYRSGAYQGYPCSRATVAIQIGQDVASIEEIQYLDKYIEIILQSEDIYAKGKSY